MKNFIEEFKVFAIRGNVVDLAVAVVIGAAFGKIVSSLVENIITPLLSILLGGINFSSLSLKLGEVVITYGVFLQSIFDFTVIALAVFVAIKALAKVHKKEEAAKAEVKKEASEDVLLLREIRDILKK